MKRKPSIARTLFLAALWLVAPAIPFTQGQVILPQGTFEQPCVDGKPVGWQIQSAEKTRLAGDAKKRWVQLRDGAVMMHVLKLSPGWQKLMISARMQAV
jgi:hypothetical protein